jgi:hypothetical protein
LQRLDSARSPCGFDSITNIPVWAQPALPTEARQQLNQPNFAPLYLQRRAGVLIQALAPLLDPAPSQQTVDAVVSFAERLNLVSVPRGTTVGWLNYLLHYGHTISGVQSGGSGANPVFATLATRTGLQLAPTPADNRDTSNARWVIKYTKGMMDTDALSDFVYGELYIPVTVAAPDQSLTFARRWTFPAGMRAAVAQYACRFDHPFWASFKVQGNTRTLTLPDGKTVITETLQRQGRDSYTYRMTGIPGLTAYTGSFTLTAAADLATLEWAVSFQCADPQTIVRVLSMIAEAAQQMTAAMTSHFSPGAAG